MSDDPIQTWVRIGDSTLEFQQYFVHEKCKPQVSGFEYRGATSARPSKALESALESPSLEGIVICPSNPYLSIAPILEISGVLSAFKKHRHVIAISPIVGGEAIKGPAAKIMQEIGAEVSPVGVARFYEGVIHTLLIDRTDARFAPRIEALGIQPVVTDTVMRTPADRVRLAQECITLLRLTTRQAV